VYKVTAAEVNDETITEIKLSRVESTRAGIVTEALRQVLNQLNERPIYKKTISAQPFILALERAFRTRISRQQQDAQEFLQVVAERVCDEYHSGHLARKKARESSAADEGGVGDDDSSTTKQAEDDMATTSVLEDQDEEDTDTLGSPIPVDDEEGFPLEGKIESRIECQACSFVPKPHVSSFVTITLNVPQRNSTTLNQCFDGMLKEEVIEDYKCDRCRLAHALSFKQAQLQKSSDQQKRSQLESDIQKIQQALEDDPEKPPEGVDLPDLKLAPKRTIKKHMRISRFPKILAIHLSRSIFDTTYSTKNQAKVSFPETLPLGTILDQKRYRLLCVVNHKGGHNSGHYETFRRQITAAPFSTPHSFGTEGAYSRTASPSISTVASPRLDALNMGSKRASGISSKSPLSPEAQTDDTVILPEQPSPLPPSPSISSLSSRSSFSISGSLRQKTRPPTSAPRESPTSSPTNDTKDESHPEMPLANHSASSVRLSTAASKIRNSSISQVAKLGKKHKKKAPNNKWWRISDDKIKESKTSEVLGQQKEVYLLFYEMIPDDEDEE
jgi:ubiquitin carboxyl-terminal hydrolase 16